MTKESNMRYSIVLGLLTLLLTFNQINGQSYIYNIKGQLIIDTTLTINQEQLEIWRLAESNILALISLNIDYSNMARESGITGVIIVGFDCDAMDLNNIRLINGLGGGLDKNLIEGIEKMSEKIVFEFRHIQGLKKREPINYLGTYYIPFDFSLIDLKEEMKKKNAIPIIDSKIPSIGRWIE
ncbi:MAG: hypothetical protein K8R58_03440 [Bacteroidales bacterium]|nr:hypothetical protein [Bacteroidales bacterium]